MAHSLGQLPHVGLADDEVVATHAFLVDHPVEDKRGWVETETIPPAEQIARCVDRMLAPCASHARYMSCSYNLVVVVHLDFSANLARLAANKYGHTDLELRPVGRTDRLTL